MKFSFISFNPRKSAAKIAFVSLFAFAFAAFHSGAAFCKSPKYKVKIGSYVTPSSPWGRAVQVTINNVVNRTNGEVQIYHMHSGMLGSTESTLEQVLMGGIQGAGIPSYDLAGIVPEAHILEMPFLFRDRAEAYYLIDNVIAPELKKKLAAKGLVTSAFMEVGLMDFVMSRDIRTPDDLKKVKIGSWESPVHISFWKAQGATPIPIPATEVFRAYSTGLVDSGANTMSALAAWDDLFGSAIDRSKIHITPIAFTYQSGILVINKQYWDAMPPAYRAVFEDELNKMTVRIRNELTKGEPASIAKLKSRGYKFFNLSPKEKAVFERNARKVYREFEPKIGKAFLQRVLAARDKYRKSRR